MALKIKTTRPQVLLNAIYTKIDKKEILTWDYDDDRDLTHISRSKQWKNKAWLHPSISGDILEFSLIGQKDVEMTCVIYAVYHGRFIEMLLSHFDRQFEIADVTAIGSSTDNFETTTNYKPELLRIGRR